MRMALDRCHHAIELAYRMLEESRRAEYAIELRMLQGSISHLFVALNGSELGDRVWLLVERVRIQGQSGESHEQFIKEIVVPTLRFIETALDEVRAERTLTLPARDKRRQGTTFGQDDRPTDDEPSCLISNTKIVLGRLLGIPFFLLMGGLFGLFSLDQFRRNDTDRHPYVFSFVSLMCLGMTHRCSRDIVFRAEFFPRYVEIRRLFSNPTYDYRELTAMVFTANRTTVHGVPVHDYYLMTIAFLDGCKHELTVSTEEMEWLAELAKVSGFRERLTFPRPASLPHP